MIYNPESLFQHPRRHILGPGVLPSTKLRPEKYVHGPAKDFNDGDQATSILTLRNVIANSMWIECTGILHYIKGYCDVMKLG